MSLYPGSRKPVIQETSSILLDGFRESQIILPSHTGTHIDVPSHLLSEGKSIGNYSANSFFGSALRIDCRNTRTISKNVIIKRLEKIPLPDFLLFYSGWDHYWGKDQYFQDFPVFESEASAYIASLPIKGVGIDAISFDPVEGNVLKNHHTLMAREIILVENLCNLDSLPESEFIFCCLPLKIEELEGCPVRAIGILEL